MRPIDNLATWASMTPPGQLIDKAAPFLGMPTTAQANANQASQLDAFTAAGGKPSGLADFAGGVTSTLPMALATKNPLVGGALVGGASTANPTDPGAVLKDTALGMVGGKLGDVAANFVGSAIAPKISDAAQALLKEGVDLTHGQILGGVVKHVEDGLSHIPVLGDLIKNAQARSLDTFNRAVVNRTLAPIGDSLPANVATGNDAFEYAADRLGKAYGDLLPTLKVQADAPFAIDLRKLTTQSKLLPESQQSQFTNILDQWVRRPLADGGGLTMDGETMKTVDSELGRLGALYSGSAAAGEREMGNLIGKVQGALRDMVQRANPQQAPILSAINKGWAGLVRVRGATASMGAASRGGVFTPANLMGAVKAADKSVGKGSFAKGKALMQDIAQNGQELLPSSVPDSGTAGRGLLTGALLAGGHGAHILLHPPTGIPLAALSAAYTKAGAKGIAPLLTSRPAGAAAVREALTKFKAPAVVAGANLLPSVGRGLLSAPQ